MINRICRSKSLRYACKGAMIYALFGIAWIYCSDAVLATLASDVEALTTLQTYKGALFIVLTAGLVFWLLRRYGLAVAVHHRDRERSEASLEMLFSALPVGVGTARGRILTSLNGRMSEMTGYAPEECIGQPVRSLYVDDAEYERVGEEVYRAMARGGSCFLDVRWRRKDGREIDVLLGVAMASEGAGPTDIVFSAMDVTQSHEQEALYRLLFQEAYEGLFLMDDTAFVDCNTRARDMYGVAHEDLVGASPLDYSPEFQPGGEKSAEAAGRYMAAALGGEPQVFGWRHLRGDGTPFDAEVSLNRLGLGGKPYLLAIVRDVTARLNDEAARRKSESITRVLYEVTNAVGSARGIDELYAAIHASLSEHIDATNFYIALVDEERDGLDYPLFFDEYDPPYPLENISDPSIRSLTLEVLRSGRPLLVGDDGDGDSVGWDRFGPEDFVGTRPAVWLGVPLAVGGKVIGAMAVQHYSDPRKYGPDDRALLVAVSEQVAMAIDRKRALDALRASEDSLSSLFQVLPTGIGVVQNRVLIEANDRYCEIFGYEHDEMIGMNARDLYVSEEEFLRCGEEIYGPIKEHGVGSTEGHMVRKDGREIYVLIKSALLSDGGDAPTYTSSVLDITDRKLALEALKANEDYLSSIFRAAPAGISVVKGRTMTAVNDRFGEIFGYQPDELVGRNARMLYSSKEEFERCGREYYEALKSQETCSVEAQGRHKDGSDLHLLVNATVLQRGGEEMVATFCVLDVTELKRTLEALHKSEESLSSIFRAVPTGIGVFEGRRFLAANERFCEMLGYEEDELLGRDTRLLYVSDEEYRRCGQEIYGQIKESGRCSVETHMVRKDGRDIHILVNGSPLSPGGDDKAITASILDITDRKRALDELSKSEEKFRRLVEDIGDRFCLFRHTTQDEMTYLSPGFEGMFGVPLSKALNRDWRAALDWTPHSIELAERQSRALRSGEVVTATFEMDYRRTDGALRTVEITEHLALDEGGASLGVEGIIVEITDRKRAEEALRTNHDKLEEMVRERTGELSDSNAELQRLIEESDNRSVQAAVLNDMGELLQACETEEETYRVVGGVCAKLFPEDAGCIGILDDDDWSIKVVAQWGGAGDCRSEFAHNDCWAIRRGKAHLVLDPGVDPLCNHVAAPPECGTLCVPMGAQGRVLGMAHMRLGAGLKVLKERERRRLAIERQILLSGVVERYAPSLVNLRLRETLREQSIRDRLTGLFNRRHMEEALRRELARARRRGFALGVVMIDVDHFKRFNDAYGHDTGDAVLRELGRFLMDSVRTEDIPCRYGGEELLLILPEGGLEQCAARAEDIRKGIETEVAVFHEGKRLNVTASLGVAAFPLHGGDVDTLLAGADAALYVAKEGGRNRVVCHTP